MGLALIAVGCLLLLLAWDALRTLTVPRLSKREVAEAMFGPGTPELSESLEHMARTRWVIQGASLAQLISVVFGLAGLAAVVFGAMLLAE